MHVTSRAGTELVVALRRRAGRRRLGLYRPSPGRMAHWPGGLCLCFPAAGSVNGTLVLAPGDVNLTFKRYLESPVTLTIENDYVTDIKGDGLDAELMRSYFAAWGDREAYAVSHVGWGMNPAARWDCDGDVRQARFQRHRAARLRRQLPLLDRRQRSRRAPHARATSTCRCANCTVALDEHVVVEDGVLSPDASMHCRRCHRAARTDAGAAARRRRQCRRLRAAGRPRFARPAGRAMRWSQPGYDGTRADRALRPRRLRRERCAVCSTRSRSARASWSATAWAAWSRRLSAQLASAPPR